MPRRAIAPVFACALAVAATFLAAPAARAVVIQFDYTYDTGGFFSDPARREALEYAGAAFERFTDELLPITPGGGNTWDATFFHPATGASASITDLAVPADTLIVYVGARPLGTTTLGSGGPGGFSASGYGDWIDIVDHRGQAGAAAYPASDFGPWGGSISFSSGASWDFSIASAPAAGQDDFYSVALHELCHLVGFGTSDAWFDQVLTAGSDHWFLGSEARGVYGDDVPLAGNGHWEWELESAVAGTLQEVAMDPDLTQGDRKRLTDLDYAALADIGWEPAMAGDADGNGFVGGVDLNALLINWGASGTSWLDGEFDGDGRVGGTDLNALLINWGSGVPPSPPLPTPEPGTLALVGVGLGSLALRRRVR